MTRVQTTSTVTRPVTRWPRAGLRILFGVIWLIDASLKWLPGFRTTYEAGVSIGPLGQPEWLRPWFRFWDAVQGPHLTAFVYLIAVAETLLGLALVAGFARKLAYLAGLGLSLLIWGVAEGFGGPYGQGSVDIGDAIMYAVVFAALIGLDYYLGADPFAVDYYLGRRITWWHRVAEVGHRRAEVGRQPGEVRRQPAGPAPADAAVRTAGPLAPPG